MRHKYDLSVTSYICDRKNCQTPIDIPSGTFYEFSGAQDSYFWCPQCEDLPCARLLGAPADSLPEKLPLLRQFVLHAVPRLEPSDDVASSNLMYRPYSQRSFLRQYLDWLALSDADSVCEFKPTATRFKKFDPATQRYTGEIDYELEDQCNGLPCRFLRAGTLKPLKDDEVRCPVLKLLCSIKKPFGLCETGDEANILRNYLLISGGEHFPMLIPQPSILSGEKRPDFLCFVPITKFQYKPVAVLIDRPVKPQRTIDTEDALYDRHGYSVYRILMDDDWKEGVSPFKAARELKNWVELENRVEVEA
jgi:hypothetical protein